MYARTDEEQELINDSNRQQPPFLKRPLYLAHQPGLGQPDRLQLATTLDTLTQHTNSTTLLRAARASNKGPHEQLTSQLLDFKEQRLTTWQV